jgi:hypothetical protein
MEFLNITSEATAIFFMWLLLPAGIHKLKPTSSFYYEVIATGYGIRSPWLAHWVPKSIGFIEIIAAVLVVVPQFRNLGAMLAGAILAAYLVMFLIQLLRGNSDTDCGCAGSEGSLKIGAPLVWRNSILCLLALYCSQSSVSGQMSSSVVFWLLAGLTALMLCLMYLSSEQLIGNAQKIQSISRHK